MGIYIYKGTKVIFGKLNKRIDKLESRIEKVGRNEEDTRNKYVRIQAQIRAIAKEVKKIANDWDIHQAKSKKFIKKCNQHDSWIKYNMNEQHKVLCKYIDNMNKILKERL